MGGWEGDARGRGYGDICIHIADSLCYTAETNNIIKQLHSNKDVDVQNGLEDMGRGKGRLGRSERVAWTYKYYQM